MKVHLWFSACALAFGCSNLMAADFTGLTPLGAEKAGNKEGTIPAWTGGLPTNAASVDSKGFLSNPFAGEKPLFVITAQNAEQYRTHLSEGQMAMLRRYPETYRLPVYPTHRTMALPERLYEAAATNAKVVKLGADGLSIENFTTSYYPFPIPKTGAEVIWNHEARYHGGNFRRWITQVTPQVNGDFTPCISKRKLSSQPRWRASSRSVRAICCNCSNSGSPRRRAWQETYCLCTRPSTR